jgi:predicted kinase
VLIVLGGLPGSGKTTLARALARRIGAVHLRIDSIEQAILGSSLAPVSVEEAGYLVGYALAGDNLRLGHRVIADSVNPLPVTREAWRGVARRAGVVALEVEIICSDPTEHRRRIESRTADISGQRLPTWQDVLSRDYHPWQSTRLVLDTAQDRLEACVDKIIAAMAAI